MMKEGEARMSAIKKCISEMTTGIPKSIKYEIKVPITTYRFTFA